MFYLKSISQSLNSIATNLSRLVREDNELKKSIAENLNFQSFDPDVFGKQEDREEREKRLLKLKAKMRENSTSQLFAEESLDFEDLVELAELQEDDNSDQNNEFDFQ